MKSADVASAVMESGAVILGILVSIIVTVCVAVEKLPDESVAVQVTMVSPIGKNSGASLVIDLILKMSYNVASPNSISLLYKSVASAIILEGAETSGAVVSIIVTTWVACEILPEVSVTVQITVVLPNWNIIGLSLDIDSIPTESDTINSPNWMKFRVGLTASPTMSCGVIIVGTVVSTTVIVCSADMVLWWLSVALHITTVEPSGNTSGASLTMEEIPDMSLASAWPISTRVSWRLVASTVRSSGTVKVGIVVSTIVTVCVAMEWFPASSVIIQVTSVSPIGNMSGAFL